MAIEWHSAKSPEQLLDEKDAEIERLKKEVEKWQYAFSVQSQKLESVLHISGVQAVLNTEDKE